MFGGSRSSKTAKCKTQLKLVVSRIKILRNKREIQVKHLRRDVAQLLHNKQEANARTRVEHAIREQNMLAAYDIIEGYCEFLSSRIQSLSGVKECPADLKEAIASLIYAGPRCADLPELLEIRSIMAAKFGKQFIATIVELRVGCGVSKRIIERLSTQPLTTEVRLKFMAEAAKEYNVKWEPEDLSLSAGEVKHQQQTPETTTAAPPTAKPRPSVGTEPSSLNSTKSTSEDFNSPKSPLASVRSNGAGYDANSEAEDSDDDQGKPEPPSPAAVPKPPAPAPQQQKHQQQYIPFVSVPNRPPAEDPYAQYYNRGIVNPYVQKPGTAKPEAVTAPVDPYAEYKRKFMVNSPRSAYADVASAAEAAAESADHAAAAARAAANLAHKHLSRESSTVDEDKVPGARPVRKLSPKNLEERVNSYLETHADDPDSSEWDSPLPKEDVHRLNPSRNLYAEQRRAERDEMIRRSTGSNVTMASERVPGEKRLSLGAARANQDTLFQRRASRAKHDDENNGLFHHEASRTKQEDDNGLFQHEGSRVWEETGFGAGKPIFDEEVPKPSANTDVFSTSSRKQAYDKDYGTRASWKSEKMFQEEKLPVFDDPAPPPPTTAATVGRIESFAVHLESMNENILSRTEKLFEKEDSDASPVVTGRKSTKFGGHVVQSRVEEKESSSDEEELSLNIRKFSTGGKLDNNGARFDTEVKLPSPKTESAEATEYDIGRTSWTLSSKPPARPPPPVLNVNTDRRRPDIQTRFHGSGVDYTETSLASGKKPYRFSGASVRTKRT